MTTRREIEQVLRSSVNGARFMTATEFGRAYGISREKAAKKLNEADVFKSGTHYFVRDIARAIWENKL